MGMAITSGLRFRYYETVRDSFSDEKDGWQMLLAGLICGAGAYGVSTPLHLLKTRAQARLANSSTGSDLTGATAIVRNGSTHPGTTNFIVEMGQMVRETGLQSLWRGSLPLSIRGAMFTSGQMLGE